MPTALIVEDDPDQADLVARLLHLREIDSIIAGTGLGALESARKSRPDLVVLDLMLPDLNGFEVCRSLRSRVETMRIPVVMVTALGDGPNRERGFRVGANAYVAKPYSPTDLLCAVDKALAWRDRLEDDRIQGEIHVVFNSEVEFLQEVNDFFVNVARSILLDENEVMHLRQAIMEMGHNAIEWGNRHQSDRLVDIFYRIHDDRLQIVVKDQGSGFNPARLPHAADPDDPIAHMDVREKLGLREGGFGLLITRGMVDEMNYNDVGNEVTLIKRFRKAEM